jgi:hypothetical protein
MSESFQKTYGALIDGQSLDNSVGRFWKPIQNVRWIITITVLIVLRDSYSLQICLLLALSWVFSALLIGFKPFESPLDVKLAIFNELMVSVYLYLMLCLTDSHGESGLRDTFGYILLYLVMGTVGVNFVKAVGISVIEAKRTCRERAKKWRKESKSQQKYLDNNKSATKALSNTEIPIKTK